MDKTKARYNVIFGFTLAAICLWVAIESFNMPRYTHLEGIYGAPGLVPFFLSLSLMFMGIAVLVTGISNGGLKNLTFKAEKALTQEEKKGLGRMLAATALIFVYVFVLLNNVHYILATALFLFAFLVAFREGNLQRRIVLPVIIAVISSVFIYYAFSQLFMIPLP